MGIVSFRHSPIRSVLWAPMQAFAAWLNPKFQPSKNYGSAVRSAVRGQPSPGQSTLAFNPGNSRTQRCRGISSSIGPGCVKAPVSRLKIVREFDSGVGPALAGRMVISGRMADVCDELERMIQRNTTTM